MILDVTHYLGGRDSLFSYVRPLILLSKLAPEDDSSSLDRVILTLDLISGRKAHHHYLVICLFLLIPTPMRI